MTPPFNVKWGVLTIFWVVFVNEKVELGFAVRLFISLNFAKLRKNANHFVNFTLIIIICSIFVKNNGMESFLIKVRNKSDYKFLLDLSKRMGFEIETLSDKIKSYIKTSPKDIPLKDEDIMNEIKTARKSSK